MPAMKAPAPQLRWRPIEKASFGLIYGAIMVLSLLLALDVQTDAPFRPAFILFGSVLAMALARTLAMLFAHGVETGERIMTWAAIREAWRGSHPILIASYPPTALFVAVGFGWLSTHAALNLSQLYCIIVLAILGARSGWVIRGGCWYPILGAISVGGMGSLLAVIKHAIN